MIFYLSFSLHSLLIWDRKSLRCTAVLQGHTGLVSCLQYDDRVTVTGSNGGTMYRDGWWWDGWGCDNSECDSWRCGRWQLKGCGCNRWRVSVNCNLTLWPFPLIKVEVASHLILIDHLAFLLFPFPSLSLFSVYVSVVGSTLLCTHAIYIYVCIIKTHVKSRHSK